MAAARLLRDPAVHFLVAGAVLFAAAGWRTDRVERSPQRIVVTRAETERLVAGFTRFHRRAPAPEEVEDLIRDRVREEVAAREATALGLDRDDAVIRRRLQQKLEFVFDDVTALAEPSDAELRAFLGAHPERFRTETRLGFRQVFLDPERRGDRIDRDAAALVATWNAPGRAGAIDAAAAGDPFLLEHEFDDLPRGEVAKLFGDRFADALEGLEPGRWHGPIGSGYGVHLVLVRDRVAGALPSLAESRDEVRREWAEARRREIVDRLYSGLLERYDVEVEAVSPDAPPAGDDAVASVPGVTGTPP